MKKKLKLFATIASLCLALAVLCFGVFSAMNVTYTIGGSISYEVNDVFATVETDVYTSSFSNSTNLLSEAKKFLTSSNVENAVQTDYKYDFTTKGIDSESYSNLDTLEDNTTGGIQVNYNLTDKRTYFVVISITNNGDNIISASVKGSMGQNANTNFVKTEPITSLSKSSNGKIVLAFMLDDVTQTIGGVDFSYVVTIGVGEYEPQAAQISVESLNEDAILSNIDFYGSKHIFSLVANYENPSKVWGLSTWLYNISLKNISIENYNSLLIVITTDKIVSGMGVINKKLTISDDPLEIATGISADTDTFVSSMDISNIQQDLCFGIATENIAGVKATITLKFTSKIVDNINKLKFTEINEGKELSVSALDDKISGDVIIPSMYNGLPVTEIESGSASDLSGKHVDGFALCNSILSITIPSSIKKIGSDAFSGTENIKKVIIENINDWASIEFGSYQSNPLEDSNNATLYIGDSIVGGEIILSGITKIGKYTFAHCASLTKVTISSTIKEICGYAFYQCNNLASVIFEDLNNWSTDMVSQMQITASTDSTKNAEYFKNYYWATWSKL